MGQSQNERYLQPNIQNILNLVHNIWVPMTSTAFADSTRQVNDPSFKLKILNSTLNCHNRCQITLKALFSSRLSTFNCLDTLVLQAESKRHRQVGRL